MKNNLRLMTAVLALNGVCTLSAQAQTPVLQWKARFGLPANTTPAWGDLDLDGRLDVILPALNGARREPSLVRLAANGALVWSAKLPALPTAGPTLADVDSDGQLDVLVASGGVLQCFSVTGKAKWNFKVGKPIESFPTVADLDLDGKNEVIFGANDNFLRCLNGRGQQKWRFETRSWIPRGAAVGQLLGDEKPEIVFGSMDSNLYCLDANGKELWNFEAGDWVASSPAIGDVDANSFNDVVFSSDDGNLYCLNRYGNKKWSAQFSEPETRRQPYVLLGDLDGKRGLETLLMTGDGRANIYAPNGGYLQNFGYSTNGSPLLADLNDDGKQEVIWAQGGQIYAQSPFGGMRRVSVSLGGQALSTPTLGDFDGDGKWEIYAANAMQGAGFVYGFEMPMRGGNAAWPTLKGDPYRTGFAPNASDYGRAARRGDLATVWEPYGAANRPTNKIQKPRRLRVTLLPLDDARGNRDGALDPGETAWVRVKIENLGSGTSYDNLLHLNLGRSFLTLDRNSAYLGAIAPGAAKTAVFRLSAPALTQIENFEFDQPEAPPTLEELAVPTRVTKRPRRRLRAKRGNLPPQTLQMEVRESGVSAAIARATVFGVPTLAPNLQIVSRQILDSKTSLTSGNGNGKLDAGENVILRLLVANKNLTTASQVRARLESKTSDILTATDAAQFGNVVPGGARRLDFSLRVAKVPNGKAAILNLKTDADTSGVTKVERTQEIKLPIGKVAPDLTPPQIVLLNPKTAIFQTRAAQITLRGQISDASKIARLSFERREQKLLPGNRFAFFRALKIGENVFPISATDAAGNSTQRFVRVVRKP